MLSPGNGETPRPEQDSREHQQKSHSDKNEPLLEIRSFFGSQVLQARQRKRREQRREQGRQRHELDRIGHQTELRDDFSHRRVNERVLAQGENQRRRRRRAEQPDAPFTHGPNRQPCQPQCADAEVIGGGPLLAMLEEHTSRFRVAKSHRHQKIRQAPPGMDQRVSV